MRTLLICLFVACGVARAGSAPADAGFDGLLESYLARYKPLWLESSAAWWEASTTGSDAAFERKKAAEKAIVALHSNRDMFARIKSMRETGRVADPVARRQLEVMYRSFLIGQADPALQNRIIEIEAKVEQTFNTHRSLVGDKKLTENDVREVLGATRDSAEAEAAWKAYMQVGAKVEAYLKELVPLRNKMARELGFANFYSMRLFLQEIDEKEFFALFDELDELTRKPFVETKREIDRARAKRFGVTEADLRPWHFGDLFFQEAPGIEGVNLDDLFAEADMIEVATRYYGSFGMPCKKIVERSDLYEKPGKSPHAFCADLDREGDIRVLCNLKKNLYWADTLVHELGHAVYDKYIDHDVPWLLREASSSITTEGAAMMFGAMVKNKDWLTRALKVDPSKADAVVKAAAREQRAEKLMFSRWTQVMVRFEHGMYANPDQNLGKLWWDLKKKYQLLNPPETVNRPDYAAKMHVLGAPVYYHSYLMGELFGAQVHHYIAETVLGGRTPSETSFYGEPKVGAYLSEKVFGPGNLYSWSELTKRATGEPLSAKYFAERYLGPKSR
jgi:peptidyl-dipeptidase A